MNYKPPFASENLVTDIKRIKEFCNVKRIRVIHTLKTDGITITFECKSTISGKIKEYTFAPWNVKYKSNQFYLDNPILCLFDKEEGCYEDSVAFTLACMKALTEKGIDVDYAWFYNPAELANELMKVYPYTLIEY